MRKEHENTGPQTIEELRVAIDSADAELVEIISQRAELARKVGVLKSENARESAREEEGIAFVPARERAVIAHAERLNKGPLSHEAIRGIFQQVIAACRNLEQPVSVAYLGPEYTFSHYAALQQFGATATLIAVDAVSDVIDLVEHGKAHYGVAPIENSTDGVIRETLDALYRSTVNIVDELNVPIRHALWGAVGRTLLSDQQQPGRTGVSNLPAPIPYSHITAVYSKSQPLAQCRNWLHRYLPGAQLIPTTSTARAAEMVVGVPEAAAICMALAAERHGLTLLADRIEDSSYNRTRFCVVGQAQSGPSGRDKTSIVFSVRHQAGSLNHALTVLEKHGINMTLIESRPTKEMPWQYLFYIDFQGHIEDANIQLALEEMKEHCFFIRVFGSYPEAV